MVDFHTCFLGVDYVYTYMLVYEHIYITTYIYTVYVYQNTHHVYLIVGFQYLLAKMTPSRHGERDPPPSVDGLKPLDKLPRRHGLKDENCKGSLYTQRLIFNLLRFSFQTNS